MDTALIKNAAGLLEKVPGTIYTFLSMHQLKIGLTLIVRQFLASSGLPFWQGCAVIFFAAVFLVVGIYRVVEFSGLGLKPGVRKVLITAHVVGVVFFSASGVFFGLDVTGRHLEDTGLLLGIAMLLLLPTHVYLNLIRRIRLKERGRI